MPRERAIGKRPESSLMIDRHEKIPHTFNLYYLA